LISLYVPATAGAANGKAGAAKPERCSRQPEKSGHHRRLDRGAYRLSESSMMHYSNCQIDIQVLIY
jgi:hypothetical protein